MNTFEFCTDENIFGALKPKAPSWANWNAIFKGMDGGALSQEEVAIWHKLTGRLYRGGSIYRNCLFLCGRQSGKDVGAARLAIKEGYCGGHEKGLLPGQKAFVLVISLNVRSNRVFLDYTKGFIHGCPLLEREVVEETQHEIHLSNGIVIAGYPCSHVSARGIKVAVFIMDEAAFFKQSGVTTDVEVFRSVRPGMATVEGSRFFILSSPYMQSGLVFDFYKRYWGNTDDPYLLVVHGASQEMNPTIDPEFLRKEQEADPSAYLREYLAQFTDDIDSLFTSEVVQRSVILNRTELPPITGVRYAAATDPSGGGQDEFTLVVAHAEQGIVVQDCLRARHSQRPQDVVSEYAGVLKSYSLSEIVGDRYSGSWVQDAFRERGITYRVSERTASEAYLELLPLLNQGNVELLDDKKQTAQLIALERRKGRTGKDSVSHPVNGHDDRCNSLALAAYEVKISRQTPTIAPLAVGLRLSPFGRDRWTA